MNELDYQRLAELGNKVRDNTALPHERDAYMDLLYRNGSITWQQWQDYRGGKNVDEIMKAAVSVGAVLLIGYLLSQLFKR